MGSHQPGSIGEEMNMISGPVPDDRGTRRALRVLADVLGPLAVLAEETSG
jgi:hypothetical protein